MFACSARHVLVAVMYSFLEALIPLFAFYQRMFSVGSTLQLARRTEL
jgi:hypothetical protein